MRTLRSPNRLPRWLPLSLPLILTACGTVATVSPATSQPSSAAPVATVEYAVPKGLVDACTAFSPILYDRLHDTTETIKEAQAYDARWSALCPGQAGSIKGAVAKAKQRQQMEPSTWTSQGISSGP
jgi:hypothetical protein